MKYRNIAITDAGIVCEVQESPMYYVAASFPLSVDADTLNEIKSCDVRQKRDSLLEEQVDTIAGNVLRWNELTAVQQQELSEYRQSLLNVPQQAGFPETIEWPSVPVWIQSEVVNG